MSYIGAVPAIAPVGENVGVGGFSCIHALDFVSCPAALHDLEKVDRFFVHVLLGLVHGIQQILRLQHLVINGQRLVIRSVVNRYDVLVLHILFLHNLTVLVCFSVSSF